MIEAEFSSPGGVAVRGTYVDGLPMIARCDLAKLLGYTSWTGMRTKVPMGLPREKLCGGTGPALCLVTPDIAALCAERCGMAGAQEAEDFLFDCVFPALRNMAAREARGEAVPKPMPRRGRKRLAERVGDLERRVGALEEEVAA